MSQRLIEELRKENLCTYFVLPLLKLNKTAFTVGNFVNCFLTPDKSKIVVEIGDLALVAGKVFIHKEYAKHGNTHEGKAYILFTIPRKWHADVLKFCAGTFSVMSEPAKKAVKAYSGLPYQKRDRNKVVTDGRILALEKHPALEEAWIKMLDSDGTTTLPDNGELLSIPGPESFIDL